jgi:hypothetical protein
LAISAMADRELSSRALAHNSRHSELDVYPELELVFSLAVATVTMAFNLDKSVQAGDVYAVERAAINAMVGHYAPIAASARCLAAAAERETPSPRAAIPSGSTDAGAESLTPALARSVLQRPVAVAVHERAAADVAAVAAELQRVRAALSLEAIAIDSCYRLALEAATSAARNVEVAPQTSELDAGR